MSHLSEIGAAIRGARQASAEIPIIATMTFDTRGYTMMGVSPEQAARSLLEAGADAIGGNCGNGPDELLPVIAKMHAVAPGRGPRREVERRDARAGRPAGGLPGRSADDGRGGARLPGGRRPDHRRVLRVDAGPPRGDGARRSESPHPA